MEYYPISDKTKELAKLLVQVWDEANTSEFLTVARTKYLDSMRGNVTYYILMPMPREKREDFELPYQYGRTEFTELEDWKLIKWQDRKSFLLFQSLRDAVDDDFVMRNNVSMGTAIGNIIINSTTGNVQGVGYAGGDVTQKMTVKQIADELTQLLGQSLIDSHEELRLAIKELSSSNEDEKPSWLKRIATTLINMLGIGADIATVAPALLFLIALL